MTKTVSKTEGKRRVGDGTPGPGRPKGSSNKTSKQLKEMILAALEKAGGETYLLKCAQDPKLAASFLTLLGKVLPTEARLAGPNGESLPPAQVAPVVNVTVRGQ